MTNFTVNSLPATGDRAELAYVQWCLALEQEHKPVPHSALAAVADFQRGAFRGDVAAQARLALAGVVRT